MFDVEDPRSVVLAPAALIAVLAAYGGSSPRRTASVVFVAFGVAWLVWGAAARVAADVPWFEALRGAMHDRVWLAALGVGAVGFSTIRADRDQKGARLWTESIESVCLSSAPANPESSPGEAEPRR